MTQSQSQEKFASKKGGGLEEPSHLNEFGLWRHWYKYSIPSLKDKKFDPNKDPKQSCEQGGVPLAQWLIITSFWDGVALPKQSNTLGPFVWCTKILSKTPAKVVKYIIRDQKWTMYVFFPHHLGCTSPESFSSRITRDFNYLGREQATSHPHTWESSWLLLCLSPMR